MQQPWPINLVSTACTGGCGVADGMEGIACVCCSAEMVCPVCFYGVGITPSWQSRSLWAAVFSVPVIACMRAQAVLIHPFKYHLACVFFTSQLPHCVCTKAGLCWYAVLPTLLVGVGGPAGPWSGCMRRVCSAADVAGGVSWLYLYLTLMQCSGGRGPHQGLQGGNYGPERGSCCLRGCDRHKRTGVGCGYLRRAQLGAHVHMGLRSPVSLRRLRASAGGRAGRRLLGRCMSPVQAG